MGKWARVSEGKERENERNRKKTEPIIEVKSGYGKKQTNKKIAQHQHHRQVAFIRLFCYICHSMLVWYTLCVCVCAVCCRLIRFESRTHRLHHTIANICVPFVLYILYTFDINSTKLLSSNLPLLNGNSNAEFVSACLCVCEFMRMACRE